MPKNTLDTGTTPVTPWPLSITFQAQAIDSAVAAYSVPIQVFMGMYNNETTLGTNITFSIKGAVGPFQFEPPGQGPSASYGYVYTNTPNSTEFVAQANAAAHYLHDLYVDFTKSARTWANALAAYNGGVGNYQGSEEQTYAKNALGFQIPATWAAALGNVSASGTNLASPGGTAGSGGTGTLINDSSGFQVGDPTNPDEDYWTAINRLCQDRYWYAFSDGETLYIADGPDLMKQTPAMNLDRVNDAGIINHLEYTWDNHLSLKTPIPTPSGWTTMGELRRGDEVFGSDGRPVRVQRLSTVKLGNPCYEVRLSDGTSIVADDTHRWETFDDTRGTGRQILSTDEIRLAARELFIRMAAPLELPERDLPVDPYLLGYWLGDGSEGGSDIAVGHEDVASLIAQIDEAGYWHRAREKRATGFAAGRTYWRVQVALEERGAVRKGTCREPGCSRVVNNRGLCYRHHEERKRRGCLAPKHQNALSVQLRGLGVLGNKHIPETYLRASVRQRLALLQGLMDSDGSVGCVIAQVNERIATGVVELLRSLSFKPRIQRTPPRSGGKRDLYVVDFPMSPHLNPFRLERKSRDYAQSVARYMPKTVASREYREITSVASVASVPVRCITVDSEDHLFLAGEGMMRTSNTAWQYAATHKKRRRSQRRTALAKITSPVEGLTDVICKIDEVRAGDVMNFSNTGPGDGQWLVGDVRRSVFETMSEITVVPALTPLSEGELNPAGYNSNNLSQYGTTVLGNGSVKGYTNPVTTWTPTRIDQGVDGTLDNPYVALGDSQIIFAVPYDSGWKGGWIVGKLTSGPLSGKYWYVAEGVYPIVNQGANVTAGTSVGRPVPSGANGITGNIETGWADPNQPMRPLAQSLPSYASADPSVKRDQSPAAMACGNSFNRLLVRLGAKPGSAQGQGVGVAPSPMPPGYP